MANLNDLLQEMADQVEGVMDMSVAGPDRLTVAGGKPCRGQHHVREQAFIRALMKTLLP